ncbi:MAG: calcium-translocating P-type ATPase, PMCA-type [Bacillota bacterium]|nr:calcium-translocating P-type ATPase, PMCA-type [Bacillota bacterium]
MIAHHEDLKTILETLQVDPERGLDSTEVEKRLAEHGENQLRETKKKTNLQRFIEQFKDVMILILIAAATISFFVSYHEGEGFHEPILIVLIVFLNAIIGVVQESKAEKALEALKNLSAPHARVLRNGEQTIIEAPLLVPGDIIFVEAGDFVPADARLLSAANLKSEESALTGESVPAEKDDSAVVPEDAPTGDKHNMIFAGCVISYGNARAVVTQTGMNTEMGKIANLLEGKGEEQTPLQKKLAALGKYLGIAALVACAVIFLIGLLEGMPAIDIFMISVALAVSAIPEGLPAIVTVVLAIGVQRMVKQKAIIRRLPAVETLGSASVICTDKTGTLTENRMTLTRAFAAEENLKEEINEENSQVIKDLLRYATLCSDGKVVFEDGNEEHIGDPTETAIIIAAHINGMDKNDLDKKYPRVAEIPFDSDRKLMTTVNQIDGTNVVIIKGAFEVLAKKCTAGNVEAGKKYANEMSKEALRILAVATKEISEVPDNPTPEQLEKGLTFLGLLGMIDPPRPEAKQAVSLCRLAGIKPVMITGDHLLTASAIACRLGILLEEDEKISGKELAAMTEDEFREKVDKISVYARVSPSDKIRIVQAWQKRGAVVAMTGDGVNDAPALKAADIGCAMGITGTDVAKEASDIILTDDNFATIVEAVRQGRGIFDNIKKVVGFLLGTNIGELLTVFLAMLIWKQTPLLSMQLLWINLVTDSFPAIALGMEPVEEDVMERKPKPKNEGIFAGGLGVRIFLQGAMFAALTLVGFAAGWKTTGDLNAGRTMAFLVIALSQVLHSYNMRSNYSLFTIGPFTNKYLNYGAGLSFALVVIIAFTPFLALMFGLVTLPSAYYIYALLLALVPIPVLELAKKLGFVKDKN